MNPHKAPSATPFAMVASFWLNRQLIMHMTRREIAARYSGTLFGMAWSFIHPLLMLAVYTFVFSVIFKSRWGLGANESRTDFAIILFAGMIMFGIFSEMINRAPMLIVSNVNYVKKVVFPLEVLPWVALISILFQSAVSLMVLLVAQLLFKFAIPWTIIILPVVLLPLIFFCMGLAWFLAALGVFVRDINQFASVLTTC